MKRVICIICMMILISGCANQREAGIYQDLGLHFDELNNLCLVTKTQVDRNDKLDVYVNNKLAARELENNDMALVIGNRDYVTTRKSTTNRRYKNYTGNTWDHVNEELSQGRRIIYDFKKKDNTPIEGRVIIALFDSGNNFVAAKTFKMSNKKKQRFNWLYNDDYCYACTTVLAYKK